MAFTVITYPDEKTLAEGLTATVTTFDDESTLKVGLENAVSMTKIVAKGEKFTLVDNAQIVNVSLEITAKGGKFTVILETV